MSATPHTESAPAASPAPRRRRRGRGHRVLLSLLLLVPFALTIVFWVRSRTRTDADGAHLGRADFAAFFTPSGNIQGVASHRGRVLLAISNLNFGAQQGLTVLGDSLPQEEFDEQVYDPVFDQAPTKKERFGFGFARSSPGDSIGRAGHLALLVPFWFLAVLTGLLPLRRVTREVRRWRWARNGRCLVCGYDLRATTAGRCPECGTPVGADSPDEDDEDDAKREAA